MRSHSSAAWPGNSYHLVAKREIICLPDYLHEQLRQEALRSRQTVASLIRSRLEKGRFATDNPGDRLIRWFGWRVFALALSSASLSRKSFTESEFLSGQIGIFASTHFSQAVKFVDGIFQAQKIGSLVIEQIDPQCFDNAWKLRLRYKDKPKISFTDLTGFVVMRENHIRRVVTADAHFAQIGLGFQIVP